MGFRSGCYARIWDKQVFDNFTKCRVTTGRKKQGSDEYVNDFSGYVSFIGEAHNFVRDINIPKSKDGKTSAGTTLRLIDIDVTTNYVPDKNGSGKGTTYTNFVVYKCELPDNNSGGNSRSGNSNSGRRNNRGYEENSNNQYANNKEEKKQNKPDDDDNELPF